MIFPNFNLHQTLCVAIIVQPGQSKSTNQTDYSINYLAGIFVTFTIIGFILGSLLRYKKYKKQGHQQIVKTIEEFPTLDKIAKNRSRQRKKQIKTLEKIWKKTP